MINVGPVVCRIINFRSTELRVFSSATVLLFCTHLITFKFIKYVYYLLLYANGYFKIYGRLKVFTASGVKIRMAFALSVYRHPAFK